MITRPTSAEILIAIRDELRTTVGPAVSNPEAQMTLGLVDALLSLVSTRTARDQRLMVDEIAAVELLAGPIGGGPERDTSGAETMSLTERYYAAGRELAVLLEDEQHPAHEAALDVLRDRLLGELSIAGALTLVGRVGSEQPDDDV